MSEKQKPKNLPVYFERYRGIVSAYFSTDKVPDYHKTLVTIHVVTVTAVLSILEFVKDDKTIPIIGIFALSGLLSVLLVVKGNS